MSIPAGQPLPSGRWGKTYATIDADKIISADIGDVATVIVAGTAGDLTVTLASGGDLTLSLAAGVPQYWTIAKLKTAGATAAKVTVGR